LRDRLDLDIVALDIQRRWISYEVSLRDRTEIAQLPYVYEIPNRFDDYDIGTDKRADTPILRRRLKWNIRRLSGSGTVENSNVVNFDIFAKKPIDSRAQFEMNAATLEAKRSRASATTPH